MELQIISDKRNSKLKEKKVIGLLTIESPLHSQLLSVVHPLDNKFL